jgi:hypothetical protein
METGSSRAGNERRTYTASDNKPYRGDNIKVSCGVFILPVLEQTNDEEYHGGSKCD